jgi:hypothetical protein
MVPAATTFAFKNWRHTSKLQVPNAKNVNVTCVMSVVGSIFNLAGCKTLPFSHDHLAFLSPGGQSLVIVYV